MQVGRRWYILPPQRGFWGEKMNLKHVRPSANLAVIILLLLSIACVSVSAGTYKDRDGGSHVWAVGKSHQLIWDNVPYVPFGVTLQPKSLAPGSGDSEYSADKAAIEAMKDAGVKDILLRPGNGGISSVSPESLQCIIDLLDANGLNYGIEVYDPPYTPLVGYVVNPAANRAEGIRKNGDISRKLSDTTSAIWVLCDSASHEVNKIGHVVALDGNITVKVSSTIEGDKLLLLYPQKSISADNPDWGLPDLWADYDHHRDNLIAFLSKLKFGKGLRYFIDPFSDKLGIRGDTDALFPTSRRFRLEYAAWLSKKYAKPSDISSAWGIGAHELASFTDAAAIIPLWRNSRGVPCVFDDSVGIGYNAEIGASTIWSDFLEFRKRSIAGYMDSMADVLKRSVVDVPVVYTANGLNQVFQSSGSIGYDGLAAPVSKSVVESSENSGLIYSMADSSRRSIWAICRLQPAGGTFQRKVDLFSLINSSHGLGSKGFLLQFEGTETPDANTLGWLHEYAIVGNRDRFFSTYVPHTIYYPQGTTNTKIKQFESGTWWLPALATSNDLNIGPTLAGYSIGSTGNQVGEIYVWSLRGKRVIHILGAAAVTVIQSSGEESQIKPKKGYIELTVGEEPVIVRGIPSTQFLPIEVVALAIQELQDTIDKSSKSLGDITVFQFQLEHAKELYDRKQFSTCLDIVKVTTAQIKDMIASKNVYPGTNAGTSGGK